MTEFCLGYTLHKADDAAVVVSGLLKFTDEVDKERLASMIAQPIMARMEELKRDA